MGSKKRGRSEVSDHEEKRQLPTEEEVDEEVVDENPSKKRVRVITEEGRDDEDEEKTSKGTNSRLVVTQFGTHDLDEWEKELAEYNNFSKPNTKALIASCVGEMEHFLGCDRFAASAEAVEMINDQRKYLHRCILKLAAEETSRTHGDPARSPATVTPGAVQAAANRLMRPRLIPIQ
jgi:hypothetical protein